MSDAQLLLFKLVLTPMLIVAASLAGRRWGPGVSGWLVGLPLTSGPIALFLALGQGPAFAATAAIGTMLGAATQGAFCVAYSHVAQHWRWLIALGAGTLAFAASTVLARTTTLPAGVLYALVVVSLITALRLLPRQTIERAAPVTPPRWDLPARMLIATSYVLLLTGLAPRLGAQLTGLMSPYPMYGAILAVFAHCQRGPEAATRVLRGLLLGLFGFASFFLVESALIERAGIPIAFGAAIATALCFQGAALWWLRRTSSTEP